MPEHHEPETTLDEALPDRLKLAEGFDPPSRQEWADLVAAVLNRGRPADRRLSGEEAVARLTTRTVDDLEIAPLYTAEDPEHPAPLGSPGRMPFTRGAAPAARRDAEEAAVSTPWDVRALHEDPDPVRTREAILLDLQRGVTSLWLEIGEHAISPDDLPTVLSEVMFDLAPVAVSSASDPTAAARAVLTVLEDAEVGSTELRGSLGLDPLGHAFRHGQERVDTDDMAEFVRTCIAEFPGLRAVTVDLRPHHDAGAGDVDELAFAVATGLEYLRALESGDHGHGGIAPAHAFGQIEFRLNATADQFLTIAKFRALRRLWARIGEECGVPEEDRGARLHAVTSLRMMSRDDPYVNMLRTTVACFAAAAGGAQAITVLPFDTVTGLPDTFSRRIARNTGLLLAEESHVGAVTDPAGGSWYVEDLTDQLARRAWAVLQEIEAAGGMTAALTSGDVTARIERTAQARRERLATRDLPLTGVSSFPMVDETPLERRPRPERPGDDLIRRDAEIFEALRDRSTAHAEATGSAPTVVLACPGTRRDYGARETFTSSLLAVGGIRTVVAEGTDEEILAAFQEADASDSLVVLCSSPVRYAEQGPGLVRALREAGVEHLLLAGRPAELGEDGESLVDGSLALGIDVVTALTGILDRLGAPTTDTDDPTRKDA